MKPSINCYKKNELEMFLEMAVKLMEEASGGLKFNRGTDMESKLSYKQGVEIAKGLRTKYAMDCAFSFSICKTCTRFNPRQVSGEGFGCCAINGPVKYQYDTCSKHSPNNETWGL